MLLLEKVVCCARFSDFKYFKELFNYLKVTFGSCEYANSWRLEGGNLVDIESEYCLAETFDVLKICSSDLFNPISWETYHYSGAQGVKPETFSIKF